jgi:hypothetical protein
MSSLRPPPPHHRYIRARRDTSLSTVVVTRRLPPHQIRLKSPLAHRFQSSTVSLCGLRQPHLDRPTPTNPIVALTIGALSPAGSFPEAFRRRSRYKPLIYPGRMLARLKDMKDRTGGLKLAVSIGPIKVSAHICNSMD